MRKYYKKFNLLAAFLQKDYKVSFTLMIVLSIVLPRVSIADSAHKRVMKKKKIDGAVLGKKQAGLAQQNSSKAESNALPKKPEYQGNELQAKALVQIAFRQNPRIHRFLKLIEVYKQKEKQVGAWPDLKVGVSALNFPLPSFNPTKTAMSGILYSISQRFPLSQRLSLKVKLAKYETLMLGELLKEEKLRIAFQIHNALYWLCYLEKEWKTQLELDRLMQQATAIAKARYTVGKAPQQNYLQALTKQSILRLQMLKIISQIKVWRHKLQGLLGNRSSLGPAPAKSLPLSRVLVNTALKKIHLYRGKYRRWQYASEQAKLLLSLANARYLPDITIQLSVRQRFANPLDTGAPFLSLGLKAPIPTWGNPVRRGFVKEAMARRQFSELKLRELMISFQEQLQIANTKLYQFEQQILIAKDQIIPLALQTYRSALAGYQVDKVKFSTLLLTLQTLSKQKLRLEKLRLKRRLLLSKLHAISGSPF